MLHFEIVFVLDLNINVFYEHTSYIHAIINCVYFASVRSVGKI